MGNGANKLFNLMGKVNNQNNSTPLVTLTVKSTNPLIFKLDEKLIITEEFYILDNTPASFTVNEEYKAMVLNNGQLYYIFNKKSVNWGNITGTLTNQTDLVNYINNFAGLPTDSIIVYNGDTIPGGFEETDWINTYNTTETRIGTWINGKPIYRKVIEFSSKLPAGDTTINHNISNLGFVINATLRVINNPEIFPYMTVQAKFVLLDQVTNTNIIIRNFTDANFYNSLTEMYCILEYTKTTD